MADRVSEPRMVLAGYLTAGAAFALLVVAPWLLDVAWAKVAGATLHLTVALGVALAGAAFMAVEKGRPFGKGLAGGALVGVFVFLAAVVVVLSG